MNGKKAKALRNEARRVSEPTKYRIRWIDKLLRKTGEDGKPKTTKRGTIIATGYRRLYKDMKYNYKNR